MSSVSVVCPCAKVALDSFDLVDWDTVFETELAESAFASMLDTRSKSPEAKASFALSNQEDETARLVISTSYKPYEDHNILKNDVCI